MSLPARLAEAELVMFSPLPPRRSGIAAYTAELVGQLGRERRVVVVVDRPADERELPGALVVSRARYLGAGWLRRLPHVYQLGNNMDHAFVYHACLRVPGVLVLHDPVLHHLVEELTLGQDNPRGYAAVMAYCHGPAGLRLARLRQCGVFSPRQHYLMPLHQQVVDASQGVLVHSRFAAARVRSTRGVPVRAIRHHVSPLVLDHDRLTRTEARARLALPDDVPVLLSLGYATRPKQVPEVLHALAQLHAEGLAFRYVIGGEPDPALELPALIRALGLEAVVRTTGYLTEDAFFSYARAADLLVNLRFPVGGETSGTLTRALGMGVPALVYDHGPAAEWPDEAVYKLGFAADPVPGLAALLGRLLADRGALAAQGGRAMVVARKEASVELSAAAYLAAIRDWA